MPARLLADENIPTRAIDALRDAGCDVLWIRQQAPESADDEVLQIAVAQGRILLTFDRDFGDLIFGQHHPARDSNALLPALEPDSIKECLSVLCVAMFPTRVGMNLPHVNYAGRR